jgi:sigma-E factor negative regulatory protein RseA
MKYANNQDSYHEQLSALADGELDAVQAQALVSASRTDAQLLQTWASYHAIGDALRAHASDAYGASARPSGAAMHTPSVLVAAPVERTMAPQVAANDSVWRWKLVAGVAALAAVGSVLWSVVGQQGGPTGEQLAQHANPAPAVVAAAEEVAPVMIRDPRLDELLAAHKQFGGASALQQPAGFLRNATFTPTGR